MYVATRACVPFVLAFQLTTPRACDSRPPPTPPPGESPPAAGGEVFTAADGTRFAVEVVATKLEIPWSLAFAPDGRLFFTERPGRVRVMSGGAVLPDPALRLDEVFAVGEAGVLGLTLHPDFAQNHFVYLVYTARHPVRGAVNRVVRYREVNNTLGEPAVLLDDLRADTIHDGARIKFGPDGKLYVTMGDANAAASLPQDLGSLNGKILRMNEDGTMPADNPFPSLIYSYGHRNPQGLDWHPITGDLWATEHGATGNDELNLIQRGANYGWPLIEGSQTRAGMEPPVLFFTPAIAPSGGSFYTGSAMAGFRNDFFYGCLGGLHLHRVRLDPANPRRVLAQERLLEGRFGRIRDVVNGPSGSLYFCTSNRDGRTTPVASDDRIARIVAAGGR